MPTARQWRRNALASLLASQSAESSTGGSREALKEPLPVRPGTGADSCMSLGGDEGVRRIDLGLTLEGRRLETVYHDGFRRPDLQVETEPERSQGRLLYRALALRTERTTLPTPNLP